VEGAGGRNKQSERSWKGRCFTVPVAAASGREPTVIALRYSALTAPPFTTLLRGVYQIIQTNEQGHDVVRLLLVRAGVHVPFGIAEGVRTPKPARASASEGLRKFVKKLIEPYLWSLAMES
jgi:hypothetical protein